MFLDPRTEWESRKLPILFIFAIPFSFLGLVDVSKVDPPLQNIILVCSTKKISKSAKFHCHSAVNSIGHFCALIWIEICYLRYYPKIKWDLVQKANLYKSEISGFCFLGLLDISHAINVTFSIANISFLLSGK